MPVGRRPAGVARIVYFEILEGDRKKAVAASNVDPQQGGGARDLRFPIQFQEVLKRMFPTPARRRGRNLHVGHISWTREDGQEASAEVQLWPPTEARPNEIRIARIHTIEPLREIPPEPQGRQYLFLIQDDTGVVRAHYPDEEMLKRTDFNRSVSRAVAQCAGSLRPSDRVMGYIDYDEGRSYCHERSA